MLTSRCVYCPHRPRPVVPIILVTVEKLAVFSGLLGLTYMAGKLTPGTCSQREDRIQYEGPSCDH